MKSRVRLKPCDIEIVGRLRPDIDPATVDALVVSIEKIGLQNPISVYFVDNFEIDGEMVDHVPVLAAGMHRLEAIKRLGFDLIECDVFGSQREARMWEISENLHRNDLDRAQRALHEAEWIKLREEQEAEVSGQLGQKLSKRGRPEGRPESGLALAARELPVKGGTEEAKRHRLRRDMEIASAGEEVLAEARKAGLAKNERALLEVARAPEDQRIAKIHEIVDRKASGVDRDLKEEAARNVASRLAERFPASEWDWLKSSLYAAGAKLIADAFVNETGAGVSTMDKAGWG